MKKDKEHFLMVGASKYTKPKSVSSIIIDQIKEGLLEGNLKAGAKLPAIEGYAREMGISKSSVREAYKMLEAIGLIETKQGDGTFICSEIKENTINPLIFELLMLQNLQSYRQVVEFRASFEPAFAVMGMNQATNEEIEYIRSKMLFIENDLIDGCIRSEDDLAFHYGILKTSHNAFAIKIGDIVYPMFKLTMKKSIATSKDAQTTIKEHRAIFEAFVAKDEQALRKALERGYQAWDQILRESQAT